MILFRSQKNSFFTVSVSGYISCSSVWPNRCLFSSLLLIKFLEHSLHSKRPTGLSVWTSTCRFRAQLDLNFWEHLLHSKGLSSMWTSICLFRLFFFKHFIEHTSHSKHSSPEWTSMCSFRSPRVLNFFEHRPWNFRRQFYILPELKSPYMSRFSIFYFCQVLHRCFFGNTR